MVYMLIKKNNYKGATALFWRRKRYNFAWRTLSLKLKRLESFFKTRNLDVWFAFFSRFTFEDFNCQRKSLLRLCYFRKNGRSRIRRRQSCFTITVIKITSFHFFFGFFSLACSFLYKDCNIRVFFDKEKKQVRMFKGSFELTSSDSLDLQLLYIELDLFFFFWKIYLFSASINPLVRQNIVSFDEPCTFRHLQEILYKLYKLDGVWYIYYDMLLLYSMRQVFWRHIKKFVRLTDLN